MSEAAAAAMVRQMLLQEHGLSPAAVRVQHARRDGPSHWIWECSAEGGAHHGDATLGELDQSLGPQVQPTGELAVVAPNPKLWS